MPDRKSERVRQNGPDKNEGRGQESSSGDRNPA